MNRLLLLLVLCLLTACGSLNSPRGTPITPEKDLSFIDKLDKNIGDVEFSVVVIPFTDSKGNVYSIDANGLVTRLEGIDASASSEATLNELTEQQVNKIYQALDADFHIVGGIRRQGEVAVLDAYMVDAYAGDVIGSAEVILPRNAESEAFLSNMPEQLPEQLITLSPVALINANTKGALRYQGIRIAPRGGLVDAFKRAFGRGSAARKKQSYTIYAPFDGDDPRDTPPPDIFGEEIDTQTCRVKLQCRWAMATSYYSLSPGFITRNYHCGYFTYINNARVKRLGVHIQPATYVPLTSHVQGLVFQGDRGFQETSWAYKFLPYDSQRDGANNVCAMAKCIRESAWTYRLLDNRPYASFGQRLSNSNSFIGAMRRECLPRITPPPAFNTEGRYAGLHYWQRVGRSWKTNKQ